MPEKPWLAHYDAGVPPTLAPYPERTLVDHIREAARLRPDATAVVYHDRTLSWSELDQASSAVAAGLSERGIERGQRVALLLPNTPQSLIMELAVWKLGATVLALNPLYSADELEHALRLGEAVMVVTLTRYYEKVKAVQPRTSVRTVVVTAIQEYFTTGMRMLYSMALARREGDVVDIEPGDARFADLRNAGPPVTSLPTPDDVALLLLSGGTTGLPKAVMATHRSLAISGVQLRVWLSSVLEEWVDSVLLPLPLYHVFGAVGVQAFSIVGHNALVLVPNPRDIGALVKTIQHSRPAFVALVPALLSALLSHRDVRAGKVDLRFIKGCFSGSAPLLQETRRRFEELTGGRIVEGYSLTEALMACTLNPVQGVNKAGSVGMPLPDVELAIADESGARVLPAGEHGEVILRAPQIMSGYWRNQPETAKTLRRFDDGDRWLFTGDIGYLDEDGYLFLVDRKKDLIKVGGMQVWPREVEEAIARHEAVAEVGVAGIADAHKGEVVKAWVVLRAGAGLTEPELRAHCRTLLAPYKVPAQFEFTSALPRSALGKVLRRELRSAPS